jgi:serine/threonine protein kinase
MGALCDFAFLGKGQYGRVYSARDTREGEATPLVAIKETLLDPDDGLPTSFIREVSTLKRLQPHRHIIGLKKVMMSHPVLRDGKEQRCGSVGLLLEHCDEDLDVWLTRNHPVALEDVLWLSFQLCLAVAECHRKAIMHRDIKPSSILLSTSDDLIILKLADSGLARAAAIPCVDLESHVVSLFWRAPELLRLATDYAYAIDIWALGVTIAQLVLGYAPWQADDSGTILRVIRETKGIGRRLRKGDAPPYRMPLSEMIKKARRVGAEQLCDLIGEMVCWEPEGRIDAAEALLHPAFAETRERYERIFGKLT